MKKFVNNIMSFEIEASKIDKIYSKNKNKRYSELKLEL